MSGGHCTRRAIVEDCSSVTHASLIEVQRLLVSASLLQRYYDETAKHYRGKMTALTRASNSCIRSAFDV